MKILLVALLYSASVALATPPVETKQVRWNKLMALVGQEMKILESAKRKGVEIKYRMLELHSERLKLIHEKNNLEFMEKSKQIGSGRDRAKYFAETIAYYNLTKDFGSKILKEEVKNSRKAEIMYAMALNSRDYGNDNITERYLIDVIALVQDPRNSLRHHAETALADFYYNEKRFPEAITFYQRVIKNTEDDWMTKHMFNLSWCYLKSHDFDNAITMIKKAYFESKNPAYVNIKDQTLENIGSFYVYAGRPLEGLEFYLENEKNPIPYLVPMAMKASDKGHEKETKEILDAAQNVIDKNEFFEHQEEVLHTYLDFYRHYNKFAEHEKMSRNLVAYYKKAHQEIAKDKKSKFKVEMKDEAIEKMRSLAGFLQVKLAKDVKKDESNYNSDELQIVLNYFSHLIILDPNRRVEYYYFRAETYYSVLQFKMAAPSYVEAVIEAKRVKNDDLARKSLNSLLALTGQEVLDKAENKKFLIFAYSEHIAFWPRDEKSEQIYPKLFEIYREIYDDKKSTSVIRDYNKAYPEHLKEQQVFMTKILDQFIDKKNTDKLTHWIGEFKTGFLSFSKDTIEKTEIVLGNILFLQYQDMAKKGERLAAAKGFESLYVHKLYPDKVKYQAAFFAAMSYLELGETVKSYHWQALAYARMTEEEKLERREEQMKMSERTYRLQDFSTAFKISEFLLKKFCSLKDDTQNRLYEIAVMTSLVEEKQNEAERILVDYSKCLKRPESRDTALAQIYQLYEKKGDFFGLRLFVKRHPVEPYISQYRYSLQKWYWEKTDVNLKEHIRAEFKALNHPETLGWLKEMNLYKDAQKDMQEIIATVVWDKPQFDGEAFNKSLEGYLMKLKTFKDNYQPLTQSTQVDLAIFTTRLFSEVYGHIGQTIQGLRPAGMDAQTVKEFQAAMKQLSSQFTTASVQYSKNLDKALKEKETLAWGSRSIASVEEVENPVFSFFTGLTMDKSKD
jgi:tetratricopeptide (TPR) repeat protein